MAALNISSSLSFSMIPTKLSSHLPQKPMFYLPLINPCVPKPASLTTNKINSNKPQPKLELFSVSSSSTATPENAKEDTPVVIEQDEIYHQNEKEKFEWYSQWYPIAPICDLDKRVPHAKTVMGMDLVVWWDRNEEKWQVFEDKCPHRLAPLSEGRIDQWGRLQCVYHGWCFDGAGDCKFIPQAPPDGPPVHTFKKACAAVYPSIEQNKIVWFWPSTETQYKNIALEKKPPYIPELDDPSYSSSMGQRDIPYGYEVLIENLMDQAHVPYAHYGIMSTPNAENRPNADREGGKPLDISVQTLDINGFLANLEHGYSKFIPPCIYYIFGSFSFETGIASSLTFEEVQQPPSDVGPRTLLIFMCIPVSPGKSRVIWSFPKKPAVWIDRLIPRWIPHIVQNLIFDSDSYLLHIEEHKILEVGQNNWQKACFIPTKADALVVAFRKWLRKYSNGQVNWGSKFSKSLPPTPPKEQLLDRYSSHVVHCSSCRTALKGFKALEVALQVIPIASIGVVAAVKQSVMSAAARTAVVCMAVLCFATSRWLSHFIYKIFYFHDYNHALK